MNNTLLVGNQMNNNLPAGEDCGCDGGSSNVDMMSRNLGMPAQQASHQNMNSSLNQNVQLVNNMAQNQNHITNNPGLNQMIAPIKQLEVNASTQMKQDDGKFCKKEVRFFLYILLALAVNEMLKFFINQSIRLNKASSNRYIFYPVIIFAVLVVFCLI
tara:strand:+ start:574 stop:1047 length:474 start_codon:yes stop_codon:yes gene_type:complete